MTATATRTYQKTLPIPMEWDGKGWQVNDPAAVEYLARPYLSPSSMNSLANCPARWAADKLIPSVEDPLSATAIGTDGHLCLERLMGDPPAKRTEIALIGHIVDLGMEKWPEDDIMRARWQAIVMEKVLGAMRITGVDLPNLDIMGLERELRGCLSNDVPFFLKIDLLYRTTKGVVVADWKTGKVHTAAEIKRFGGRDDEGDQLRFYVDAVDQIDGERPISAVLLYTAGAKARKISTTAPAMKGTLDKAAKAWAVMQSASETGHFPARVHNFCVNCPLMAACPVAVEAGKEPRPNVPDVTTIGLVPLKVFTPPPPSLDQVDRVDMLDDLIEYLDSLPAEPLSAPEVIYVPDAADEVDESDIDPQEDEQPQDHGDLARHLDDHPPPSALVAGEAVQHQPDTEREALTTMSSDRYSRHEGKTWDRSEDGEGLLDPTSYAAGALNGLADHSYEVVAKAVEDGTLPAFSGAAVSQVFATLRAIILEVQHSVFGWEDWQRGSNVRARGHVYTVTKQRPMPFGGTNAQWEEWASNVVKTASWLANQALHGYHVTPALSDEPWAMLASDYTPVAQAPAPAPVATQPDEGETYVDLGVVEEYVEVDDFAEELDLLEG